MSDLVTVQNNKSVQHNNTIEFTRDDIELIKSTICKGATDGELKLFTNTCRSLGLNPFARQIFAVKRWDSKERREVMSIQVSIDGLRLAAERTGLYGGQLGPFFSNGEIAVNEKGLRDVVWFDGWPFDEAPKLAKVGVIRKDFAEPLWAQAKMSSYAQTTKDGALTHMWQKMPEIMLSKCAESQALRKAFPQELSGVYTTEEMGQANKDRNSQPVNLDRQDQIEKMVAAFSALYQKQHGARIDDDSITSILEEVVQKPFRTFGDQDIAILKRHYHDLLTGAKSWFVDVSEPSAKPDVEDLDAMFSQSQAQVTDAEVI